MLFWLLLDWRSGSFPECSRLRLSRLKESLLHVSPVHFPDILGSIYHFNISLEQTLLLTLKLVKGSHERVIRAQQHFNIIAMSLILLTAVMIAINSLLIGRSIVTPLATLQKGIDFVGQGNLSYKFKTTAQNEFGQLSNAFDLMTERLLRMTVSRDELVKEIAERRRAEQALMESEERFRRALENIPDVVVIYDSDLRIRYINAATSRITGRPTSDFNRSDK